MPAPKPKKGDKVRVIPQVAERSRDHVYTVAEVMRGKPYPYYLDDGVEDNPRHTGPFKADELVPVDR